MHACRNRAFAAAVAVCAVAGTPLAAVRAQQPAAGQPQLLQPQSQAQPESPSQPLQLGPVRLKPPTRLKPTQPAPEAAPAAEPEVVHPDYKAGPAGRSVTTLTSVGASGIQVDRLQVVTPDSAGILTTENGGFGVDMWRGATMASALDMLSRVPARIGSPTLAGLVHRLVLTPAAPPQGGSDGEQLAVARLGVLVATAAYPAALDLLSVMPRQGRGPGIVRAEAELRFLTGDNVAGCGLVGGEVKRNQADFWQKALVYCQLLSDQPEKAELGISMLREVGNEDALFFRLSEAMAAGKTVTLGEVVKPSALVTAMLGYAVLEAMPQAFATFAPGTLRALALNAKLAPPLRLVAAERAAMFGVFGDSALRKLVLKIVELLPPEQEGTTPAAASPEGSKETGHEGTTKGAVQRARLYAAAQRAGVPAAKAEATSRALRSAHADGVFAATVRLFRDELALVPASTENTWFAADAVRASAAMGAIEQARSWLLLLKRSALLSPESADTLTGLQALAHVMGAANAGPEAGELRATDVRHTVLARAILAGLGETVDAAHWLTLADPLEDGVQQPPMPAPALWFAFRAMTDGPGAPGAEARTALESAMAANKTVEAGVVVSTLDAPTPGARSDLENKAARVLVMARLAGHARPADLNPIVLAEVIRALRAMGLDKEARAFGLEAALGAGL